MRPNILLIVFDTARADAFQPYGAPAGASPALADLASSGSATAATFATASWTLPSHLSLFSGLPPRAAGFRPVGGMANHRPHVRAVEERMLPKILSGAGYRTVGFSANRWISDVTGFDTSFDEFVFVHGWRMKKLASASWRTRIAWYREGLRARVDDGAAQLERRLDAWLSDRGRSPFFWFVNLIECHSPYLPPKPYNDLSPMARVLAAREARRYLTLPSIWKCSTGGFDVPGGAIERMRRLYAASIRQLDDWLARVLEALDRHRVLEDTQVVVTSDHGENLGDANMLGHAFSLDDRLLRVPLVTAGPQPLPESGIFSLQGVPRWLAGIAEVPEHGFPDVGPDVAVAQFDSPLEPGDPRVGEAIRDWGLDGGVAKETERRLTTSFDCATDGTLKLVRRLGREELFDLDADPLEEHPAVVDPAQERAHGARLARLRAALDRGSEHAPTPGTESQPVEMSAEETAELEAQMRLLGYL